LKIITAFTAEHTQNNCVTTASHQSTEHTHTLKHSMQQPTCHETRPLGGTPSDPLPAALL